MFKAFLAFCAFLLLMGVISLYPWVFLFVIGTLIAYPLVNKRDL